MRKERVVFDRPIGQNQAIQHPLAKCWAELEAANLMAFKAASPLRQGRAVRHRGQRGEVSRRRGRVPGLRDRAADAWRHGLRQGVPRRALFARGADRAHRAGHAAHDPELHRRAGARAAEVVLSRREPMPRHFRKARVPRAAQTGGRRGPVRQSRHHRVAADGCVRGRQRDPLRARPAGSRRDGDGGRLRAGVRQARGGQPARHARARQRHGHALRRAEGRLADPGHRRPARPGLQPSPSRSCGPTCRRSRGRW